MPIATSAFITTVLRPHYHGNLMISLQAWSTFAWIACNKRGFLFIGFRQGHKSSISKRIYEKPVTLHCRNMRDIFENTREKLIAITFRVIIFNDIEWETANAREISGGWIISIIMFWCYLFSQRVKPDDNESSTSWSVSGLLRISLASHDNASVKVVRRHWKSKRRNFIFSQNCGCWCSNTPRCKVTPWSNRDQIRFPSTYKAGP